MDAAQTADAWGLSPWADAGLAGASAMTAASSSPDRMTRSLFMMRSYSSSNTVIAAEHDIDTVRAGLTHPEADTALGLRLAVGTHVAHAVAVDTHRSDVGVLQGVLLLRSGRTTRPTRIGVVDVR